MTSNPVQFFLDPPNIIAPDAKLYVMPSALKYGHLARNSVENGNAEWLIPGRLSFDMCRIFARHGRQIATWELDLGRLPHWVPTLEENHEENINAQLARLGKFNPYWAGIEISDPAIMGIVNITPDSFSDSGSDLQVGSALETISRLARQGADIIDIGGESTRPGSESIALSEEFDRVHPVWTMIGQHSELGKKTVFSSDTRKSKVMTLALESGASIINDVSGLRDDPASMAVVATARTNVILMHRQGSSKSMNEQPEYHFTPLDVFDLLEKRILECEANGIPRGKIAVDPGIGFGKRGIHNRQIMHYLPLFHALGCPVLLGVSRKSFLSKHEQKFKPNQRIPGSIAALTIGLDAGVQIFRVHDVLETKQAIETWSAIRFAAE